MLFAEYFPSDEYVEEQWAKKRLLKKEKSTPLTQEEVLQNMEKEKQKAIEKDAEKLNHEAKKITQLQHKIVKKKEKYAELEKDLGEREKKLEEVSQTEKVKEAKLQEGHDLEFSYKEKIEEVFYGAKKFTKDLLYSAHIWLVPDEKMENKTEQKLKTAKKRAEDLKTGLTKKLAKKIELSNEKLQKKAREIEELKAQLKNKERKYAEIEDEMAYDQLCEAKILEAERKLKEKNHKRPCHWHHHEHEIVE